MFFLGILNVSPRRTIKLPSELSRPELAAGSDGLVSGSPSFSTLCKAWAAWATCAAAKRSKPEMSCPTSSSLPNCCSEGN